MSPADAISQLKAVNGNQTKQCKVKTHKQLIASTLQKAKTMTQSLASQAATSNNRVEEDESPIIASGTNIDNTDNIGKKPKPIHWTNDAIKHRPSMFTFSSRKHAGWVDRGTEDELSIAHTNRICLFKSNLAAKAEKAKDNIPVSNSNINTNGMASGSINDILSKDTTNHAYGESQVHLADDEMKAKEQLVGKADVDEKRNQNALEGPKDDAKPQLQQPDNGARTDNKCDYEDRLSKLHAELKDIRALLEKNIAVSTSEEPSFSVPKDVVFASDASTRSGGSIMSRGPRRHNVAISKPQLNITHRAKHCAFRSIGGRRIAREKSITFSPNSSYACDEDSLLFEAPTWSTSEP